MAVMLLALSSAHGRDNSQPPRMDLDGLVQQKRYIELEHALATTGSALSPQDAAYFRGVLANRANQVPVSIQLLEPLAPLLAGSDSARAEQALCTLADDYAKSFRYRDAATAYARASHVAAQRNSESLCDASREASRWALLSGAPPQTVQPGRTSTIASHRDALGLYEVEVAAGGYTGSWIVDSGATLSVVGRSAAEAMGLVLSASQETAEGSGGRSVAVRTGVIPALRLGETVVRNVAVLVVDDADLNFPQIGYRVEGSLGLPVLTALGRVTFHADGHVDLGRTGQDTGANADDHNLFLERFIPVVAADFGHGDQLFTLDTGAMGTILSAGFYEEDKDRLDPANLRTLELVGAGGSLVSASYRVRGMVARVGGACTSIDGTEVLTESTGLHDEFYGNIGQSALASFSSVTLDFDAMQFSATGATGSCDPGHAR